MRNALPLLLVGAVFWVLSRKEGKPVVNANTKPANVNRSLDALRPLFRVKVEQLLQRLRALGFKPLVWETYRSPERAARLAAQGSGIAKSMHSTGLAVDIVEQDKRWDAPPEFWAALDREAKALGLSRVRHRERDGVLRVDKPHVQALPGYLDGRAYAASDEERDALLKQRYVG